MKGEIWHTWKTTMKFNGEICNDRVGLRIGGGIWFFVQPRLEVFSIEAKVQR
jgi:hypothetical protein